MTPLDSLRWLRAVLAVALALAVGLGFPEPTHATHQGGTADPGSRPDLPPDDPCANNGGAPDDAGMDMNGSGLEGDPVRVTSGRFILTRTDLVVRGLFPIQFRRTYDSQSSVDTPMGSRWSHNFELRLFKFPDGSLLVRKLCGGTASFMQSGGVITPMSPLTPETLVENVDGTFTLRHLDGLEANFDRRGRLESIADRVGNALEMVYASEDRVRLRSTSRFAASISSAVPASGGSSSTTTSALEGMSTFTYQLSEVRERASDGTLTGRKITLSYDEDTNRIVQVTAHDGRFVRYEHAAERPIVPPIVSGGLQLRFARVTAGNLEKVTGLTGIVETYGYGDADPHNLTSAQYAQGTAALVLEYDGRDRVIRQVQGQTEFTFDYSTPLQTTVTRRIFDAAGAPLRTSVKRYEYNAERFLTALVDSVGNRFVNVRDDDGRRTKYQVFPAGSGNTPSRETSFTYYPNGQLKDEIVTLDSGETVTQTFEYDQGLTSAVQVVSSEDPDQIFRYEMVWAHDAQGFPTVPEAYRQRKSDGSFVVTEVETNALGQITLVKPPRLPGKPAVQFRTTYYPLTGPSPGLVQERRIELDEVPIVNGRTTFNYDPRGFPTSSTTPGALATDPDVTTSVEYDDLGRPLRITNPLGEETLLSYGGPTAGRPTQDFLTGSPGYFLVQIERGRRAGVGGGQLRRFEIDPMGRLLRALRAPDINAPDVFEAVGTATYDSDGNLLTLSTASGRTQSYDYDARGSLISVTTNGRETTIESNAEGRPERITDPEQRVRSFVYDDLERVIETEVRGGDELIRTAFRYDAAGNQIAVTNNAGRTTTYEYDTLSQLRFIRPSDGPATEFRYDDAGQNTELINARGNVVRFGYTALGDLETVEERESASAPPTRTRTYGYDRRGNLRTLSDSAIQGGAPLYGFDYDPLDRMTEQVAKYIPGPGGAIVDRTIRSSFDRFGNVETATLDDIGESFEQTFVFDAANRLRQSVLPSGIQVDLSYEIDDLLAEILYDDNLRVGFAYDTAGVLEDIRVASGPAPGIQQHMLAYTRNPDGTLLTATEQTTAGSVQSSFGYEYDDIGRVKEVSYTGEFDIDATERFAYDDAGNRIDPTDPAAFDYDDRDRLVSTPDGRTYTPDEDGNITKITLPGGDEIRFDYDPSGQVTTFTNAATGIAATLAYDGFGRKISQTVNGETTYYLWEGDNLLAEYDGQTGERIVRYGYLTGSAPVTVAAREPGEAEQALIAVIGFEGAPRVLADTSGEVMWRASYSPLGRAEVDTDPDGDQKPVENGIRGFARIQAKEEPAFRLMGSGSGSNQRPQPMHTDSQGSPEYDPNMGRQNTPSPEAEASGENPYQELPPADLGDGSDLFADLGPFPNPTPRPDGGVGEFKNDPCPTPSPMDDDEPADAFQDAEDTLYGLLALLQAGKISAEELIPVLSAGLAIAGQFPGLGEIADVLDAVLSAAQGDFIGAGFSLVSAIPVVGNLVGAGRTAARAAAATATVNRLLELARRVGQALRKGADEFGCFVGGTVVTTPNGLVPIEEISPGDLVLSRSEETGEVAWKRVVQTFVHDQREVLDLEVVDGTGRTEVLGVTAGHPFWVDGSGWVQAGDLQPGADVYTSAGDTAKVVGSSWRAHAETVFNFEVEDFHSYFVGASGSWVHNTSAVLEISKAAQRALARDAKIAIPDLETLAGAKDLARFQRALGKSVLDGRSGAKFFKTPTPDGFTVELKIRRSGARLLGNIGDDGVLTFTKFVDAANKPRQIIP